MLFWVVGTLEFVCLKIEKKTRNWPNFFLPYHQRLSASKYEFYIVFSLENPKEISSKLSSSKILKSCQKNFNKKNFFCLCPLSRVSVMMFLCVLLLCVYVCVCVCVYVCVVCVCCVCEFCEGCVCYTTACTVQLPCCNCYFFVLPEGKQTQIVLYQLNEKTTSFLSYDYTNTTVHCLLQPKYGFFATRSHLKNVEKFKIFENHGNYLLAWNCYFLRRITLNSCVILVYMRLISQELSAKKFGEKNFSTKFWWSQDGLKTKCLKTVSRILGDSVVLKLKNFWNLSHFVSCFFSLKENIKRNLNFVFWSYDKYKKFKLEWNFKRTMTIFQKF